MKSGRETNWKRQYKLRHNWSRGACNVRETEIAERPSNPPLLVRFHNGVIVTVDSSAGLRAWSMKGELKLIAATTLPCNEAGNFAAPTSLSIDTSNGKTQDFEIAIGFADARFSVYQLLREERSLVHRFTHSPSSAGAILAIAYALPYILTISEIQILSLYHFNEKVDIKDDEPRNIVPRLLSSLKSHTAWPPLSLAIRSSSTNVFASIVYSMPTYLSGWSVGLQEFRLKSDGSILESRLASGLNQGFTALPALKSAHLNARKASPSQRTEDLGTSLPLTQPTSLSYTHPYLLAAHPDNTLTLYMVTSNSEELSIGAGHKLWGHTSSVSGAHVSDRGKAVSVSTHGNELRVWELEGGIFSTASKRRIATGEACVHVRPERNVKKRDTPNKSAKTKSHGSYLKSMEELDSEEVAVSKGWVAFDEENVILLREKGQGAQTLVVYDFT